MRKFLMVGFVGLFAAAISTAQSSTGAAAQVAASNRVFVTASQGANSQQSQNQQEQRDQKKTGAQASANASASASANAGGRQANASSEFSSDTVIEAALAKPLDSRKNKPGDPVEAKVTKDVKSDGQVVIPKGSKLFGRVTEARAKSKTEAESSLGVVFDRARLKDGREMPVNAVIQAVAAAESMAAASAGHDDFMAGGATSGRAAGSGSASGGSAGGGGLVGGVTSTVSATAGTAVNTVGAVGQSADAVVGSTTGAAGSVAGGGNRNIVGSLRSSSHGVIGLQGLNLQFEGSNATHGALVTSSTKNVRLDSGTRLLLRVAGQKESSQEKQ